MIVDSSPIVDYPFSGSFYRITIDDSASLEQRTQSRVLILETECDIQESTVWDNSGANNVSFKVYFPFSLENGVSIRRGDRFEGLMYGVPVEGEVSGIFPTQLGGCEVHLKDFTV